MLLGLLLACHPKQFESDTDVDDSDRPDDTDVVVHDPLRTTKIPAGFAFEATRAVPFVITIPDSTQISSGILDIATPLLTRPANQ